MATIQHMMQKEKAIVTISAESYTFSTLHFLAYLLRTTKLIYTANLAYNLVLYMHDNVIKYTSKVYKAGCRSARVREI
jgi:hypothetical protein